MKKDKFKNKSRTIPVKERRFNYTATMSGSVLEALDKQDGDRSANIERAVKSYYLIG